MVNDSETASSAAAARDTNGPGNASRTASARRRSNVSVLLFVPVKAALYVNDKSEDVNKELENNRLFVNAKAQF
jgi:hypothetical protein